MAKIPYVAIVGQTNVGKSSLFNRLYGSQEAIVAREAGTTRDNVIRKITLPLIEESRNRRIGNSQNRLSSQAKYLSRLGKDEAVSPDSLDYIERENSTNATFWLVDTAGLKPAEDEFEANIQDQIAEATELADIILVVVDGTLYPSEEDRRITKTALKSKKPVFLVVNKTDLKGSLSIDEFRRLGIKDILFTSAEHNRGITKLTHRILENLPTIADNSTVSDSLKIALIGRPNVGKSHLFNTLAGKQQALVANIAGTTRDVNRVSIKYKNQDIELLDTAGIRRNGKQEPGIEKFSVLRTLSAIDESDVCLLLMDVNELNTQIDQKLAGLIKEAGKGLILVVSKWDIAEDRDAYTRDDLAPRISHEFAFVPWAPLIFTSAVTGQNVTKLFELAREIRQRREQQFKTTELNKILQECVAKHPPAGLKNTFPKLRYIVQTDTSPPWFVIFGGNLKLLHWSYKRYLETQFRNHLDLIGTPIMFSFRQEDKSSRNKNKDIKKN
ncbi:ribosome biogenesis GTPase Der [Candidatus Saccharibacteria bacterium]|nr:ribosome biogenesis GTPase Der [Candidatus Saccharibacteria bacterium]